MAVFDASVLVGAKYDGPGHIVVVSALWQEGLYCWGSDLGEKSGREMANGQGIGHTWEIYGVVVGPALFSVEGACGKLRSAAIAIVEEVLGGSSLVAGWLFITSKCLVGGVGGEILELHGGGAIARSDAEIGASLAAL
jgi:hypothetical protein